MLQTIADVEKPEFVYRDSMGNTTGINRFIPGCVTCYSSHIHGKDFHFVEQELEKGIDYLADMTAILMQGISREPGSRIINPYEICTAAEFAREVNNSHHLQCAAHFYIGLLLMATDERTRELVEAKIREQGLPGRVRVELMPDFNLEGECREAAKYPGNSIDLYTVRVGLDGRLQTEFYEGDEETVEQRILQFFR